MTNNPDDACWIRATSDPDTGRPMCLMTWGSLEVPLTIEVVRNTARELLAAAAGADADEALIAELRETISAPDHLIGHMLSRVRERRGKAALAPGAVALQIETGVSATRWVGFVKIRRGSKAGQLEPSEACGMAQQWFEAAEAAERDAITRYVLRESDKFTDDEIEAFFERMAEVRTKG